VDFAPPLAAFPPFADEPPELDFAPPEPDCAPPASDLAPPVKDMAPPALAPPPPAAEASLPASAFTPLVPSSLPHAPTPRARASASAASLRETNGQQRLMLDNVHQIDFSRVEGDDTAKHD
jgi:hypothetical protein